MSNSTQFAYVTLVTTPAYIAGALVLAQSLIQSNSPYQRVVLFTDNIPQDGLTALSSMYDVLIPVTTLHSTNAQNLLVLGRPDLHSTFTKLYAWTLTQFKKCVFLDADTLVLSNIDNLFDYPELSAAPDCGWPDIFNSGVFVFQPSLETFDRLLDFAKEHGSWDGGDQGLLNAYYSDWSTRSTHRIPFLYNVTPTSVYSYAPAFLTFRKDIKVVHYIGLQKPWTYEFYTDGSLVPKGSDTSVFMDLLQLWWDVYASYRRTHGVKTGWTTSSPSTLTPKWTSLPNLPTQLPTHPSPSTPQGSTHAPWAHMDKYQWPEHEFDNGLMQSLKSLQITGNQHGGQAPFSSSLSSDKDKRRSGHKEVSPTQPALVGMQHNFSGLDATTTTATTFPSPSTPIISSSNPTMVNTNKKQSISSASIPTESSSGTKKQTTSTISTIEVEKETKSTHPTLPSMSTRTKSTEATSSAPQISTSSTPVSSKSSTTTTTTSNTNPNPTTSSGKGGFSKFFGKKN